MSAAWITGTEMAKTREFSSGQKVISERRRTSGDGNTVFRFFFATADWN